MKVLFTGGRYFNDIDHFLATVERFEEMHGPITTIIQGGATGADALAHVLYIYFRTTTESPRPYIEEIQLDADWDQYGKRAGHLRNQDMVNLQPDWVIPMPGNKGTADCLKRCKKANIPVFTI